MNSRAKMSAVVLGLIGGSVNALLALVALGTLIAGISQLTGSFDATGPILAFVAVIVVCSVNFIGSLVCIRRRIAGGVMMIITAVLLLVVLIIGSVNITKYNYYGPEIIALIAVIVFIIEELLSITGAIICFTSGSSVPAPQYGMYGQLNPYQAYGQPQQPFVQPQYGPQNPYQSYAPPFYGGQSQQPYGQPQPQQPYTEQPNKTEE